MFRREMIMNRLTLTFAVAAACAAAPAWAQSADTIKQAEERLAAAAATLAN